MSLKKKFALTKTIMKSIKRIENKLEAYSLIIKKSSIKGNA